MQEERRILRAQRGEGPEEPPNLAEPEQEEPPRPRPVTPVHKKWKKGVLQPGDAERHNNPEASEAGEVLSVRAGSVRSVGSTGATTAVVGAEGLG